MTALYTRALSIGYEDKSIASGLTLTLKRGELVCLLGPNGVGKSTLLRTLVGVQPALSGEVQLTGADIRSPADRAKHLAVVLTDRVDAASLTVYELVALGRHPYTGWFGRLSDDDHALIERAIEAVGAEDIAHEPLNAISDGQRQKAMIARALAQDPQILVLDEPTAYLDVVHRVEVMGILRQLAHDQGRAVLLSTHDLDLALRRADTVWLMAREGGEAHIQVGTPEDLVLAGAFAHTFDRGQVSFDAATGAFALAQQSGPGVHVAGEGQAAVWTRRALVRRGFQLDEGATTVVTVGDGLWQVGPQQVESIGALLTLLQRQHPI